MTVLTIDQGTFATKALVVGPGGRGAGEAERPVRTAVATGWEVVGRRPEEFSSDACAEMLGRYPRPGFGAEFLACVEDQARRKGGQCRLDQGP